MQKKDLSKPIKEYLDFAGNAVINEKQEDLLNEIKRVNSERSNVIEKYWADFVDGIKQQLPGEALNSLKTFYEIAEGNGLETLEDRILNLLNYLNSLFELFVQNENQKS